MDKIHKPLYISLISGFYFMALVQSSHGLELDAQLDIGYDTNPLELADQFSPDASSFAKLDLSLRQELSDNLRVSGKFNTQKYFTESDADNTNLATRIDYKVKSKLAKRKVTYRFDAEYNQVDRTYVSKNLGRVGETLTGVQLADRYDANWIDYRARMDIDFTKLVRLDLNLLGRDKSYENFNDQGLSNLDYSQWLFEPNLRFSPTKQSLLSLSFLVGKRNFDNRNGRDLVTGSFLADTQLVYDFQGTEIFWRFRPDEQQQIRLGFQHEQRKDNVSGYFDSTNNVLRLAYRNKPSDKQRIDLSIVYRDFSYDNSLDQGLLETEESILSKDGFDLSTKYARQILSFGDSDIWAEVGFGYAQFDSVDDAYIYDKAYGLVGLKYFLP